MHQLRGSGIAAAAVATGSAIHRGLSLPDKRLGVSGAFVVFLCSLLGAIVLLQLVLVKLVHRYRHSPTLELHQPYVLAAYVIVAAVATGSCVLFVPFGDAACALRDVFLLLPLTLMGNILVARSWRVNVLMAPALGVGRHDEKISTHDARRRRLKRRLVNGLWSGAHWLQGGGLRRASAGSLRQKVTLRQLGLLVCALNMPQLVVQICKLSIPTLRPEVDEAAGGVPFCRVSSEGEIVRWIGWVLTAVPVIMLTILSSHDGGLPLLQAYDASAWRSILLVCVAASIAVPASYLGAGAEARAYLHASVVVACTASTCWFFVAEKLLLAHRNEQERVCARTAMLQVRRTATPGDSEENEKLTNLALEMGKVYEKIGLVEKCMEAYEDRIKAYQFELPRHHDAQLVGGYYTMTEIESFTGRDVSSVIRLFAAKGKVSGTGECDSTDYSAPVRVVYKDALDIYDRCPSAAMLEDHSILFPVFSGLFLQIKAGKVEDMDERALVDKFVDVTKLHRDDVHVTRALAMRCEINARLGHFTTALDSFDLLKTIYDPGLHHEGICKAYGSDRSAQAFSAAIYWLQHTCKYEEAKRLSKFVVEEILPKMDPQNVHNTVMVLLPVLKKMKNEGKLSEARSLFQTHVCRNFDRYFGDDGTTPCLSMFTPLTHLLDVLEHGSRMPNLNEVVKWAAVDDNGVSTEFLDAAITSAGWSPHCLTAELCLELSKVVAVDDGRYKEKLREKSLKLARRSFDKMIDKGTRSINMHIAFADCEPIIIALDKRYTPILSDKLMATKHIGSKRTLFPRTGTL